MILPFRELSTDMNILNSDNISCLIITKIAPSRKDFS